MTRKEKEKLIEAFNVFQKKVMDGDFVKLDAPFVKDKDIVMKIDDDIYEELQPFLFSYVKKEYHVGDASLNIEGTLECSCLYYGDNHYVIFRIEPVMVVHELYNMVYLTVNMSKATYKEIHSPNLPFNVMVTDLFRSFKGL